MRELAGRLERAFFERHTVTVARQLLGKLVMRRTDDGILRGGRIVETEAYHGRRDRACHAARGQTKRNTPMFGPAGHAYVYLIYGMWHCLNVVTLAEGFPAAVLVRALAPLPGLPFTRTAPREGAGPGKLCRALGVDRTLSGADLITGTSLWLADDGTSVPRGHVVTGPRIGVDYAGTCAERPWRFWLGGHPDVSRLPRRHAVVS